jgi:hypothetical protein
MRLAGVILATLLTVAPAGPRQRTAPADQAVFRSRTDVVSVTVSVQRGRAPVGDLTADDFVLLDNGVPQKIDALSLERMPLDLTLVIAASVLGTLALLPDDWTRETINRLDDVEVIRRLLTPSDRLRVVLIDRTIRGELLDPGAPIRRSKSPSRVWWYPEAWNGRIRLADGIFYALAWPVPADRRHLMVVIAEGRDTGSALGMRVVPRLAARSDAVVHAVLRFPQGPATNYRDQARLGTSDPALGAAVEQTGGTILEPADFERTLRQIVSDFRASYLLRYTPLGVALPGWHELTVNIRRPGDYTIRARRGYEGG